MSAFLIVYCTWSFCVVMLLEVIARSMDEASGKEPIPILKSLWHCVTGPITLPVVLYKATK